MYVPYLGHPKKTLLKFTISQSQREILVDSNASCLLGDHGNKAKWHCKRTFRSPNLITILRLHHHGSKTQKQQQQQRQRKTVKLNWVLTSNNLPLIPRSPKHSPRGMPRQRWSTAVTCAPRYTCEQTGDGGLIYTEVKWRKVQLKRLW